MRALELVAIVLFLLGCLWLLRALLREWARRQEMQRAAAQRWHETHQLEAGGSRRLVFVERPGEREPVGSVPIAAKDYEDRFHELMAEARQRAAMLNSEGS